MKINASTGVVIAGLNQLRSIRDSRQHRKFVWPEEGDVIGDEFEFNTNHADYEPLLIDMQTANVMITVYDALNTVNQVKFREWCGKSRAHFCRMSEISWEALKR